MRGAMSLKAKCQATYSDFKRNVAVISKNRKTSAIYGSSIRLQPNPPEYLIPASRRRKRSASKDDEESASRDGEEGASKDDEEGGSSHGPASISFTKVLTMGAIHTAGCCRLILPRAFCEKHKVERNVTMTDSTMYKQWHMRFQSCGTSLSSSRARVYAISNGWREFSYDHSLKVNDRLVFTLLSTSHFVVEFATSNRLTRAMLPTRDGKDYPWKINYSRLNCLSYANDDDSSKVWPQAVKKKVIRKRVTPKTSEEEEEQEEKGEDIRSLSRGRHESSITLPNKQQPQQPQQPQKEMFCQCDIAKVGKRTNNTNDSRKEYVLPEFTHLECKNPDGSSYLQIVDSGSEMTSVDGD